VLNPATIRYFAVHRVLDIAQISAAASWFRYMNLDGSVAYQEPGRYRFTAYSALYRGFLRAVDEGRYHLGEECIGFDQDADGVTVRFAGGRVERADLLVCADGINSIGRRLLLPEVRPRYAGIAGRRASACTFSSASPQPATGVPFLRTFTPMHVARRHIGDPRRRPLQDAGGPVTARRRGSTPPADGPLATACPGVARPPHPGNGAG
jgi:2-polyprenyl-6-methoxyphenol hydroxylase-like FAD-dependent oxidoreductase